MDPMLLAQRTVWAATAPPTTRRWGMLWIPQSSVLGDSCARAPLPHQPPWSLPTQHYCKPPWCLSSAPSHCAPKTVVQAHIPLIFLLFQELDHPKKLFLLLSYDWWGALLGQLVLQTTSNLVHQGHKLETSLWSSRCEHHHRAPRPTSLPNTKENRCTWTVCMLGCNHSSGSSRTSHCISGSVPLLFSFLIPSPSAASPPCLHRNPLSACARGRGRGRLGFLFPNEGKNCRNSCPTKA